MNLADLPLAKECMDWQELLEGLEQLGVSYPPFEHIEDGCVIDLGGVTLEVLYLPGHTPGEIVLLDRQDRILFSGDGIPEHLWLQLPESLSAAVQIESMKRLLPLRDTFDIILHGHCRQPAGIELFDTLLSAPEDLVQGNTADDIDYEWFRQVSKAHPYRPNDRRIVYKDSIDA